MSSTDDPIFGLIERHRSLAANFAAINQGKEDAEKKSEAEEQADSEMTDAAVELCDTPPATIGGAVALARYVIDHIDASGGVAWGFPDYLVNDDESDENSRSYEYFILKAIADTLDRLAAEQQRAA